MSPKPLPQTNSSRAGASWLAFFAEGLPLTVREAAVHLGVSVQTVYRWVERKQIPHLRVMGRNIRFLKADLAPFRAQFKREAMSRPMNNDGRLFRKEESKFWRMDYRDRDGKRQRESTNREDWEESQKELLRGRLQARDSNTLAMLRKGEQLTFAQWAEHFLEAFSKPPIWTQKAHLSYARVAEHLNARMGEVLLADLTADMIGTYLRAVCRSVSKSLRRRATC